MTSKTAAQTGTTLPASPAAGSARASEKSPQRVPLSQRVFALQQIIPLGILAVVMFYEVMSHLIFQTEVHPLLFAVETLTFGILGPAFTWITLNWVAREIRERKIAVTC